MSERSSRRGPANVARSRPTSWRGRPVVTLAQTCSKTRRPSADRGFLKAPGNAHTSSRAAALSSSRPRRLAKRRVTGLSSCDCGERKSPWLAPSLSRCVAQRRRRSAITKCIGSVHAHGGRQRFQRATQIRRDRCPFNSRARATAAADGFGWRAREVLNSVRVPPDCDASSSIGVGSTAIPAGVLRRRRASTRSGVRWADPIAVRPRG